MVATLVLLGTPEPDSMLHSFLIRTAAGGVLVMKLKERLNVADYFLCHFRHLLDYKCGNGRPGGGPPLARRTASLPLCRDTGSSLLAILAYLSTTST